MTRSSLSIFLFLSAILFSCCSNRDQAIEQFMFSIPLNTDLEMNGTTSMRVKGLNIRFTLKQPVEGVIRYHIDLSGQGTDFYSYKDDIYTFSPGYGKNAIILQRGSYEVIAGKPDDGLMSVVMPIYSCCMPYVHPDMPDYGIRLGYCEENSGVISGKIRLGADIPTYSSFKFTLIEKENGAVLKRVILER